LFLHFSQGCLCGFYFFVFQMIFQMGAQMGFKNTLSHFMHVFGIGSKKSLGCRASFVFGAPVGFHAQQYQFLNLWLTQVFFAQLLGQDMRNGIAIIVGDGGKLLEQLLLLADGAVVYSARQNFQMVGVLGVFLNISQSI